MYLVTGGAGFIGSNLVHALLAEGARVRVLDNLATGHLDNLAEVKDKIEFMEGDIREIDACRKAMQGVQFVLHQAALPSVPRSLKDPVSSCAVNIQGTLNLLVAARDQNVQRFVYASSSSVYGDTPTLPKTESMVPNPLSPYAVTKLSGEQFCKVFSRAFGLVTPSLRYFNVYGPRQDPNSPYAAVIPRFITSCLRSVPATIFGDGLQSRDFTFVGDCVAANLLACKATYPGGEACNIGSGARITIADLYAAIRRATGGGQHAEFVAPRVGDVKHSLADIAAAGKLLGYVPRHALEDGLTQTVAWFKKLNETTQHT